MITIHEFKQKIFLTEADAPPAGAAPPAGGAPPAAGGAPPPGGDAGGLGGSLGGDLGGLGGGGMGGGAPPPGSDLGGAIGGAGGGGTTPITDIKKLNAWDLLKKFFHDKKDPKEDEDPLDKYT